MSNRLQDKIILVTGAAQGIGRGIADAMAAQGATVIATDIQEQTTQEDGSAHSLALTLRHDVTQEESWQEVAVAVERQFGRLDVLVNNAGIVLTGPVEKTSHADWKRVMSINVDSVFLGCKTLLPLLRSGGAHHAGGASVINLSSVLGMVGVVDEMAYSVSKAAVRQAARTLAIEWAQHGYNIRANSLHPGIIRTKMMDKYIQERIASTKESAEAAWQSLKDLAPLRRMGEVKDVAAAAIYLASEEASFVNATELVVDGGFIGR